LTGSASITGTVQEGETLTAATTNLSGTGTIGYQWQRSDSANGNFTDISGATSTTYTVVSADAGKYLRVAVNRAGYTGTIKSASVGPATLAVITGPDIYAIGIDFGGWPAVGQMPTGTSGVKLTNTGNGIYMWQGTMTRDSTFKFHDDSVTTWDNGTWYGPGTNNTPIVTGSQVSITISGNSDDAGAWITGEDGEYSITLNVSSRKITFNKLSIEGEASITGTVQVGQTLTATTTNLSGTGNIGYQWQKGDSANDNFIDIIGAISNTYTLAAVDYNKYIRVVVNRVGYSGTVISAALGPVTPVVPVYNAVWILGPNGNWGIDQAPLLMNKESDGTFTWTGIVSQNQYFRFALEDTHNWNDDKDRGQRFQPETDGAAVTLGDQITMPFVDRNQGIASAWRLDATAGTYTFVVDPSNRTLAVVQTTGGPPPRPSGLTKTAATTGSISIEWNSVYGAKAYDVYVGTTSSNKTVRGSSETINYTITGLTAGTTYYISITAKNDAGSSDSSPEISVVTKPLVPSGLTKGTVTSHSIIVSWNAVSGADNYKVYAGTSADAMEVKGSSTSTSYGLTLLPNTEYYIAVSSVKSDEESELSGTITAKTKLAAPSGVVAEPLLASNAIRLTWNSVESAASYKIYRSLSEDSGYISITTTSTASYNDMERTQGTTYYYKVSAVDSSGVEGDQSQAVSAVVSSTTKAVTAFKFVDFGATDINGSINGTNITVTVPSIVNITSLAPTITHNGKSINPASGLAQDFSSPVQYTVTGGDNTTQNYTVTVNVENDSLTAAFTWLKNNAKGTGAYTIIPRRDESIAPTSLFYDYKSVGITLTGGGSERKINLLGNGYLFVIKDYVTLTLDNNITLQGKSGNSGSLVVVNGESAELVMNNGSKITGNTYTVSGDNADISGSGIYVGKGTFTMNGGTVSNNTLTFTGDYGNGYGAGVCVESQGYFVMNGGSISNNTIATSAFRAYGGGVYVYNGTFLLKGGTISGNTANSYARFSTPYSYGGGVYVGGGYANFTMQGGTITGNKASSITPLLATATSYAYGGGVSIYNGNFTKSGGSISSNSLEGDVTTANAVYIDSNGNVSIYNSDPGSGSW
jgi:hypothetical protein